MNSTLQALLCANMEIFQPVGAHGVQQNERSKASPDSLAVQPLRKVRRCHIQVADQERPLPGVYWRGSFYSFLKHFSDEQKLKAAAQRLLAQGEWLLVTTTAKGSAIWVREEGAELAPERSAE